ncbi:MAG: hypothetical protein QOJ16_595 [Acidobacteriota bacterium]|nr:hypothetical protein [Acidobacteriota bacterium]
MKFFFDNCVAWRVAEALALLLELDGFEIVALRSRFPENCPDEKWMPTLGNEGGWNVISGDRRIIRNPQRRRVWMESRLTTFFLAPAWSNDAFTEREKHLRLLKRWNEIVECATKADQGTAFILPYTGKIERLKV